MKTRKSITLEVPLPQIGGGVQNPTAFKRHLAASATKYLQKTLNDQWIKDQYIQFLKAEENERRKLFKKHVAELKAGKSTKSATTIPPSPVEAALIVSQADQQTVASSKKAPVATTGKERDQNE